MDISQLNLTAQFPLLAALLLGLLGGVHCVGMCGGIVGMLSFNLPRELRGQPRRQLPYLLGYNAGRILSYTLAGVLAGGIGTLAAGILPLHLAQKILLALAGSMMLALGLYLAGFAPQVARIEALGKPLWRRIEPLARRFMPVRSPVQAAYLGALWGWLPCGLVYSALIMTLSAGSAWRGGLMMFLFGLGTLPTLLVMGSVAASLTQFTQKPAVRRVAGLTVAVFGLLTFLFLSGHGPHGGMVH